MPIVDSSSGVVTLKVVYYGPAGGGKTTNLEKLSVHLQGNETGRLTPRRMGANRFVSVALPAGSMGRLNGASLAVRLETMQGEVSSDGGGWPQALADADGIVFVADSSPHARIANLKALAAIRERLEGRGRSATAIPVLMQWNKRDLADARSIADMETQLNDHCGPSIASTSLRGTGVIDTLIDILKRTMEAAQRKSGGTVVAAKELERIVSTGIERLSQSALATSTERFGTTIELQPSAWPDVREPAPAHRGSEGAWSREPVYSAESLVENSSATRMLAALELLTLGLSDPRLTGPPPRLMAGLLAGSDRSHGSLLAFRPGSSQLDECEVVPSGRDPLNVPRFTPGATKAATLCSGHKPQFIRDLAGEAFVDGVVPGAEQLQGALIVPLVFSGLSLGGMVVYVDKGERVPTAAELAYWRTAAALTSAWLAWQLAEDRPLASRQTAQRPDAGAANSSDIADA